MKNKIQCYFLFLLCLLMASTSVASSNERLSLFNLINQRLSYMDDVALYKALHHYPIEDVKREQVVIKKAILQASKHDLDASKVTAFFKAQIAVAKAIQFRYRADLLSQPLKVQSKSLHEEIRPILIELGEQIIEEIALYAKEYDSLNGINFDEFNAAITTNYVTLRDKRLLFNALKAIRLNSSKN